jgi:hypothetical protein
MRASSSPPDGAAGALGEDQVDGDDVRGGEQLVLVHPPDAGRRGALVGEVRAPGDDVHLEGLPDTGDAGAEPAEADDAEAGAGEIGADGRLPAAGAQGGVLGGDVPGDREDQRPGQLGGAGGVRGGPADGDAAVAGGGEVDGGVAGAGGDQQPQLRQAVEQAARERRPLAHGHDDVEGGQPLGDGVLVVEVVGKRHDLQRLGDARPVGELRRGPLVVVEDGDPVDGAPARDRAGAVVRAGQRP